MKPRQLLALAFVALLSFSCQSIGYTISVANESKPITDHLKFTLTRYTTDLKTIAFGDETVTNGQRGEVHSVAQFKIENSSPVVSSILPRARNFTLVYLERYTEQIGKVRASQIVSSPTLANRTLGANQECSISVLFSLPPNAVHLGVVVDGTHSFDLIKPQSKWRLGYEEFLEDLTAVNRFVELAKTASFEQLELERKKNNFTWDDVNDQGLTPFVVALLANNTSVVEALKKADYKISRYYLYQGDFVNLLMLSSILNRIDVYQWAVKNGLSVSETTKMGVSSLNYIVKYGRLEFLKWLSQEGFDLAKAKVINSNVAVVSLEAYAQETKNPYSIEYFRRNAQGTSFSKIDLQEVVRAVEQNEVKARPTPQPVGSSNVIPGLIKPEKASGTNDLKILPDANGMHFAYSNPGAYADFDAAVLESGTYRIALSYAANMPDGRNRNAEIRWNGSTIAYLSLPTTGDWSTFKIVQSNPVRLTAGKGKLRIVFVDAGFDVSSIAFSKVEE